MKGLFNILDGDQDQLRLTVEGLKAESEAIDANERNIHQNFCLKLVEQFGNDVGVIFIFLMNIVTPEKG